MHSNTARIAKNTLMLYFRQIVIMLVSLYTVRVVLNTLGAEDYGIYNIVAGVVVMFTFLNGAMTHATQRFLNFAMGQNDTEQVRNVFSISFVIHTLIAILVILLAETVGLWFFYTWLNIPLERQNAAFIVYQFSVVLMSINILLVPYRATIIAYEKMSFFALMSIIEVLLKLAVVFLLTLILFDKLVVYSFLILVIGFIIFFLHKIYCNKMFETAHFRYCNDKKLFQQLIEFSGWNVFGQIAIVSRSHGINVLLNIFYGVTLNAAMGISTQINTTIYTFVTNLQTAFRPQIIKSYAAKENDYFMKLIFQVSKVSFYLLFVICLPLFMNTDFVLKLWLKNVPEYTVIFTQLMLLNSLETSLTTPLMMSIHATGDIKRYQFIGSFLVFLNLPFSFLSLKIGFHPASVLVIKIAINVLTLIWRIYFSNRKVNLPIICYLHEVIIPIIIIATISGIVNMFLCVFFVEWTRLIASCVISITSTSCLAYAIGLNRQERVFLKNWIKKRLRLRQLGID